MKSRQHDAGGNAGGSGLFIPLVGGLLLSLDVPLLKLANTDVWTMAAVRGVMLCMALLVVWLVLYRARGKRQPFVNGWVGWVVALMTAVANLSFLTAIHTTSVANVVFILAFNPMFTALLSWLVLGERLAWQTWAAIVVSLVGVAIIVAEGFGAGTWAGDLMALATAILLAEVLTLIRWSRTDQSMSPALGHLSSGLVASSLATPGSLSLAGWGWLSVNGLLVMPASTALLMLGPRYVAAAVVAMFFLLETVLTPVWMWLIFAEAPSPISLAGGLLVITTILLHSLWSLSRGHRSVDGSGPVYKGKINPKTTY